MDASKFADVFMMLDDEETEDLVFLYLQSLGWYVVPNSRKGDTMKFEYLAVNPQNGDRALTQVKTGNVSLNREEYCKYAEKVFLFQSEERYTGKGSTNVTCLKKDDLYRFLVNSLHWLPSVFQIKHQLVATDQTQQNT